MIGDDSWYREVEEKNYPLLPPPFKVQMVEEYWGDATSPSERTNAGGVLRNWLLDGRIYLNMDKTVSIYIDIDIEQSIQKSTTIIAHLF